MVLLYVPNIIGYFRVFFIIPVILFPNKQQLFCFSYFISQFLDMFDGYAARKLNQCSHFGVVLDMVADRILNAILLAINGSLYPSLRIIFYGDIILDISSHWYRMYSTLICGQNHHKTAKSKQYLLRLYYENKIFMGVLITGNEVFLMSMYFLHFEQPIFPRVIIYIGVVLGGILFAIKKIIHVIQLKSSQDKDRMNLYMNLQTRFEKALQYIKSGSKKPSNQQRLNLYSFYKQITVGQNKSKQPSKLKVEQYYKWKAWKNLKQMTKQEAMKNYIKLLTQINSDWQIPDSKL